MTQHIGIIASALIGALVGIVGLFWGRRKLLAEVGKLQAERDMVRADEAEKLTRIAMGLLEPLQARIAELERLSKQQSDAIGALSIKLEKSSHVIRALLRGMALLIHQLRELNVTPAFVIPIYENGNVEEIERALLGGLE